MGMFPKVPPLVGDCSFCSVIK